MLINEDLAQDLNLHLQELGKDITAEKVVEFLWCDDIKLSMELQRKSPFAQHKRYLHALGLPMAGAKEGPIR